jgi:hypothetical protein
MATLESIAIRKTDAQNRMDSAAAVLATNIGASPPDWALVQSYGQHPDVQAAVRMEVIADFIDGVAGKLGSTQDEAVSVETVEPAVKPPPKPVQHRKTRGRPKGAGRK